MAGDDISTGNGSLGLPLEILVEIFAHSLPSDPARLSKPPQLLPPFTLARVCSLWRKLVLSSPQLWSRIVLGYYGTDSAREVAVFDTFLERAGSTVLDLVHVPQSGEALQVMLNQVANARYEEDTITLIKKVCANINRFRTLDLDVLDAVVLEPLFSVLSTPSMVAPRLKNLKISTTHLGSSSGARRLSNMTLSSPYLRHVSLMTPPLLPGPRPGSNAPALEYMRSLKLRFCVAVEHALDWIDTCPNLESLNVRLFNRVDEHDEDPEIDEFNGLDSEGEIDEEIEGDGLGGEGWVVVLDPRTRPGRGTQINTAAPNRSLRLLTQLTCLELHSFSSPSSIGVVLDNLTVPALKTLKISTSIITFGSSNARWLHLPLLLRRSDPPLEELRLLNTLMNADDMRTCLMLTPRLKVLAIGMTDTAEVSTVLADLTVGRARQGVESSSEDDSPGNPQFRGGTLLCPQLRVLDVTNSLFDIDDLVTMVSSRQSLPQREAESDDVASLDLSSLVEVRVHKDIVETIKADPTIRNCLHSGLKLTAAEADVGLGMRLLDQVYETL